MYAVKKWIALLLGLLLMFSAALAEEEAAGWQYVLPADTLVIEDEAFQHCWFAMEAILPDGLQSIGARAFDDTWLVKTFIPDSVTFIGEDAFPADMIVISSEESYAHAWAVEHGYPWQSSDENARRYYALIIGQSYTGVSGISSLPMCIQDAGGMKDMLKGMTATPFQTVLRIEETGEDILDDIETAFGEAREGDVCLFYYSGHGHYSPGDPSAQGALIGTDFTGITLDYLRSVLDEIPADKIVILDSCYSGNFLGDEELTERSVAKEDLAAINSAVLSHFAYAPRSASGGNYYVMTAARFDEKSYGVESKSNPQGSYSLFTRALLEGSGYSQTGGSWLDRMYADGNDDAAISLSEGFGYAYANTLRMCEVRELDPPQHAQVYPGGSSFVLWGMQP